MEDIKELQEPKDDVKIQKPKRKKMSSVPLYKKAHAKAMYLAGYTPDDIARSLDLRSSEVITNWAKKDNWIEERDKVMQKTTAERLQELLKQQEVSLRELKTIRDKAIDAINRDLVTPGKYSEAANAYINALEMERKIKIEALQISFISDVAQILKEEIQDRNLLFRIAERFRELFNKYQSQSFSVTEKKVEE